MSVPSRKRTESSFEVFHHFYVMRREIMNLIINGFGYSESRQLKNLQKHSGSVPFEDLPEYDKNQYTSKATKIKNLAKWFLPYEGEVLIDILRRIGANIFEANSIYPTMLLEYEQRRLLQDEAIGACYTLMQELQFVVESLPVDVNKYTRLADIIDRQIALIRQWRKSDNRFKKQFQNEVSSKAAANFANVNNNGNANSNNASNSYGVRPISSNIIHSEY